MNTHETGVAGPAMNAAGEGTRGMRVGAPRVVC